MTAVDPATIEHFVRHTLGCKCPDEVFESVAVECAPTPDSTIFATRVVIGNRLLIYVREVPDGIDATAAVTEMARRGRAERDTCGYNRFRLVLASPDPTCSRKSAADAFAQALGDDDRAHLHLLAIRQVPHTLRRFGSVAS